MQHIIQYVFLTYFDPKQIAKQNFYVIQLFSAKTFLNVLSIDFNKNCRNFQYCRHIPKTKMNWSGPNVINFGRKLQFGPNQFILVVTISFWSRPNHYGQVQINLVRPKPFWTDQNCFGHIEGQGNNFFLLQFEIKLGFGIPKPSGVIGFFGINFKLPSFN